MPSPTYDTVLLPPAEVAALSVQASDLLAPLGRFRLRERDVAIPHLSLYMSTHDAEGVARVVERLAQIAISTPALPLTATRHAQMPDGFVEVQYEAVPELASLQDELLAAVAPLRDGLPERTPNGTPITRAIELAAGEERSNYERWGYPECGGEFRPHISFTRLRDPAVAADLDGLPPASAFSGRFARLALCTMGDHGTCPAVVAEWELG